MEGWQQVVEGLATYGVGSTSDRLAGAGHAVKTKCINYQLVVRGLMWLQTQLIDMPSLGHWHAAPTLLVG